MAREGKGQMRGKLSRGLAAALAMAMAMAVFVTTGPVKIAHAYLSDPASVVNPTIGTDKWCSSTSTSCQPGLNVVGATLPFGMLQWGPIYTHSDTTINGYSLTSFDGCGSGCFAANNVPILPTQGSMSGDQSGVTDILDHTQETAQPGYYKLGTSGGSGITTTLTGTTRAGLADFNYPSSTQSNLLFKLANLSSSTTWQVMSCTELQGSVTRHSSNPSGAPTANSQYTLYFDAVFNVSFTQFGTWNKGSSPTLTNCTGGQQPVVNNAAGGVVVFNTSSQADVLSRVGISYVSAANAANNRSSEITTWTLSTVQTDAHNAWNNVLNQIQIAGGSTTEQTIFYSTLYHALMYPNVYSDVNGQYTGWDGNLHTTASGHTEYGSFPSWDIARGDFALESMILPSTQVGDMVTSLLDDYAQSNQLNPYGVNDNNRYIMGADPVDTMIAAAYAFGAGADFDATTALNDMVAQATNTTTNVVRPADGLADYISNGYVPYDSAPFHCCAFRGYSSNQEDWTQDDFAIAQLATALGQTATATTYNNRAQQWQNTFDPAVNFFQPRSRAGVFRSANTPAATNCYGCSGFLQKDLDIPFNMDGTKYQYAPFIYHDLQGLIDAFGGNSNYASFLDSLSGFSCANPCTSPSWDVTSQDTNRLQLTNEPSLATPWEYDWVGQPWKTQSLVRNAELNLWSNAPGGLPGNGDNGGLDAWYPWAAIGFYPVIPGTANLVLNSPLFTNVLVHMGNGFTITETAPAAADNAPFVQSLTVNGSSYSNTYLPPSLLGANVTMTWTLGTTPNTSWASAASSAPPSMTTGLLPALGFVASDNTAAYAENVAQDVVVHANGNTSLILGVQSMSSGAQTVTWTSTVPSGSGLTVSPSSGSLSPNGEAPASQMVWLSASSSAPHGQYTVTFDLTSGSTALPSVNVAVGVDPVFDGYGIVSDATEQSLSFDGTYAYSQQALGAAGFGPGAAITSGGVKYTWPNVTAGTIDNIAATGQVVSVSAPSGATVLGVLGASSGGAATSGTLTITYTDGTTTSGTLSMGDWVSGGGTGNTTVVTTSYRDAVASGNFGTADSGTGTAVNVYASTFSINSSKTVASVTLPTINPQIACNQYNPNATSSCMHIFAIGTDKGAVTLNTSSAVGTSAFFVQSGPVVSSGSGNATPTMSTASTSGHLLVVTLAGGSSSGTVNFSAPPGWVRAALNTTFSGSNTVNDVEIWYYQKNPGGISSATFTSSGSFARAQMSEFRGLSWNSPVDQTGTMSNTGGTSATVSSNGATISSGEVAITNLQEDLGTANTDSLTPGSGWTNLGNNNSSSVEFHENFDYKIGPTEGAVASETVTASRSGTSWAGIIVTFKSF